jgi:hypothetical protein
MLLLWTLLLPMIDDVADGEGLSSAVGSLSGVL